MPSLLTAAHLFSAGIVLLASTAAQAQSAGAPHLEQRGKATQLIVDGKPFLVLGGELHNSSSSDLAYMTPIWPKLKGMNLNTVLAPVAWETVEPQEVLVESIEQALRWDSRNSQVVVRAAVRFCCPGHGHECAGAPQWASCSRRHAASSPPQQLDLLS